MKNNLIASLFMFLYHALVSFLPRTIYVGNRDKVVVLTEICCAILSTHSRFLHLTRAVDKFLNSRNSTKIMVYGIFKDDCYYG